MHYAHILYKNALLLSIISDVQANWSASLQDAWKMQNVREALNGGIVKLSYLTDSGNENIQIGTRSPEFIPMKKRPKHSDEQEVEDGFAEPCYDTIKYFDVDKWAWRSFKVENLQAAELMEANIHVTIKDKGRKIYG